MADLSADILQNAQGPQAASGDGHSVTSQSVAAQIEADRYLAAKQAAAIKSPLGGVRLSRTIPVSEPYFRP